MTFIKKWAFIAFVFILLALFASAAPVHPQTLTSTQRVTVGKYLSASMTLVDITQDSLARLSPWLATSQSARAARISAIRNGRDSTTTLTSTLTRLGNTLDSLFYLTADTTAVPIASGIYFSVRAARHPPLPPLKKTNITSTRYIEPFATYGLFIQDTTIRDRTAVVVRGHSSTPDLNGQTFYARVRLSGLIGLYRDTLFTRPVWPQSLGSGGTVEFRQR